MLAFGAQATDAAYIYAQLESPGSGPSSALGINNLGQVVGTSNLGATLWTDSKVIGLGLIDGRSGTPLAINDLGQIVGYTYQDIGSVTSPAIWQAGSGSGLPSGAVGSAVDINNSGVAVGSASNTLGTQKYPLLIWENGQVQNIGVGTGPLDVRPVAINDSGTIVGDDSEWVSLGTFRVGAPRAAVWKNGIESFLQLGSGYVSSNARDINNAGLVVGTSFTKESLSHATLWRDGAAIDLGTAGGDTSSAVGINNSGQVVGNYQINGGTSHGVLWVDGGYVDLSSFLDSTLLDQGWLFNAVDINDSGVIVGDIYNINEAGAYYAATLTPAQVVPELQTWVLMMLGLGFTFVAIRRSKYKYVHLDV